MCVLVSPRARTGETPVLRTSSKARESEYDLDGMWYGITSNGHVVEPGWKKEGKKEKITSRPGGVVRVIVSQKQEGPRLESSERRLTYASTSTREVVTRARFGRYMMLAGPRIMGTGEGHSSRACERAAYRHR